jgi:uncharacterized protein (DUF1499 family)
MLYVLVGVIVVLVLVPVVFLATLSVSSKKPENLGVQQGHLSPCPDSPNCVSSRADDAGHRIEPISFKGSPDEAVARLKAALRNIPRTQIVSEKGDYLHAEATSLLFRFVDDVEFLVDRDAKVIHVRSASRVGHSDLGANRARVERIREEFRE